MSKTIQVKINRTPGELIVKARKAASENGVRFHGNEEHGHFAGHGIEGNYRIRDNLLSIHIVKKPFIMPWTLIESTVKGYFA